MGHNSSTGRGKDRKGSILDNNKDYLSNSGIEASRAEVIEQKVGVPHGSVLEPSLWNLFYDDLLGVYLPEGCGLVAYADDLVLYIQAEKLPVLKDKVETAIRSVEKWMAGNRVQLASHKTEAIIFHRGHRRAKDVVFKHGSDIIVLKRAMKYLGI